MDKANVPGILEHLKEIEEAEADSEADTAVSMYGTLDSPQFVHDCKACTFLGHREGYDVYLCQQGGNLPTLIARYGDDGPQYSSGMGFVANGAFFEAASVATEEEAVRHHPCPRVREPGERASWVNVTAAVLAEYVLVNRVFERAEKGDEAGVLRISLWARERDFARAEQLFDALRRDTGINVPTGEQLVARVVNRLTGHAKWFRQLREALGLLAGLIEHNQGIDWESRRAMNDRLHDALVATDRIQSTLEGR